MKNLLKYAMLFAAAGTLSMSFTACSSDDDNNSSDDGFNIVTTTPIVDQDTYTANTSNYKDKSFGQIAIDNCATLVNKLVAANQAIASSNLSSEQEAYLYKVLENIVDKVYEREDEDTLVDIEVLKQTFEREGLLGSDFDFE